MKLLDVENSKVNKKTTLKHQHVTGQKLRQRLSVIEKTPTKIQQKRSSQQTHIKEKQKTERKS